MIGIPWNEKAADRLGVMHKSIENLMRGIENTNVKADVVVFDDSANGMYADQMSDDFGYRVVCEDMHHGHIGAESPLWEDTIEEKITYARNQLREIFLDDNKYTHLFWLESDVLCPEHTLPTLLRYKKDNITATRPQHGGIPGVFPFRDDIPRDLWKTRAFPNFRVVQWDWLCPSGLKLISCYGGGCSLVSRRAMQSAEFWVKPHSPATHDIIHCMELDALGYPCYADTGLLCAHYFKPRPPKDERFDYGGDWNNLEPHREHTVQWKKLKEMIE